jgi:hypothetical protein
MFFPLPTIAVGDGGGGVGTGKREGKDPEPVKNRPEPQHCLEIKGFQNEMKRCDRKGAKNNAKGRNQRNATETKLKKRTRGSNHRKATRYKLFSAI